MLKASQIPEKAICMQNFSVFVVSNKAYFYFLKCFLCVCPCVACNSICLKWAQKKRGLKHKAGMMPLSTPTLFIPKGKLLHSVVIARKRSYFRTWYFLYLKIKRFISFYILISSSFCSLSPGSVFSAVLMPTPPPPFRSVS